MLRIVVQQPQFLAWIGYWNKLAMSDKHIVYAGVQYLQGGHQNRVQMNGQWATLPVLRSMTTMIKDVRLKDSRRAVTKIGKTVQQTYGLKKYQHRDRLDPLLDLMSSWESEWLLDLQMATTDLLISLLGLKVETVVSTTVYEGDKVDKLRQCLVPEPSMILMSGGGGRGLGYESIPNVAEVLYQKVHDGVDTGSILGLLVSEKDPKSLIEQAACWS